MRSGLSRDWMNLICAYSVCLSSIGSLQQSTTQPRRETRNRGQGAKFCMLRLSWWLLGGWSSVPWRWTDGLRAWMCSLSVIRVLNTDCPWSGRRGNGHMRCRRRSWWWFFSAGRGVLRMSLESALAPLGPCELLQYCTYYYYFILLYKMFVSIRDTVEDANGCCAIL